MKKIFELKIWDISYCATICGIGVYLIKKGIDGFIEIDK